MIGTPFHVPEGVNEDMLLKVLSLACAFGAVSLGVNALGEQVAAGWKRRIASYAEWMNRELQAMFYQGMSAARARRILTWTVLAGGALGFLVGSGLLGRLFVAAIGATAGYLGPWAVVAIARKRRTAAVDDQIIDTLQMMANGLKAGRNLRHVFDLVVREMKPPMAEEFGQLVADIERGHLTEQALQRFADRLPLEDIRLVVDSILTLRETGGDLAKTFQVIADTIVERKKVQGKIEAMTAQGVTQGVIVSLAPIGLMLLFSLIDPTYMQPFYSTPIGWLMMGLVFALSGIGLWLMFALQRVLV